MAEDEPIYADPGNLDRLYDNIKRREVQTFDTVAAMQAATYLEAGMVCHTNGYTTSGDGGAAYYTVGTSGDIALQDGLYASEVNVSLSNAAIDEITDGGTPSSDGLLDETGLAHFWDSLKSKSYMASRDVPFELEQVVSTELSTALIENNLYVQGAAYDGSNVFIYAIPKSTSSARPRVYKLDASLSIVGTLVFDEESPGHGNDMYYDSVLDTIVIASSNRNCTRVAKDLSTYSRLTNLPGVYVSEFCANDTIGIANCTGSNQFVFYNRHADGIFTACGTATYDLNRGAGYNYLQGSFMTDRCFYAITSSTSFGTSLACIGFNGAHICNFVNRSIMKELENAFIMGDYVYFVSADGEVYKTQLAKLQPRVQSISTRPSATLHPWLSYSFQEGPSDVDITNVFKYVSVPYDGTHTVAFQVTVPNYKHTDGSISLYDLPVFKWSNFRGPLTVTRVTNGSYRVYGALPYGCFVQLVYVAAGSIQYLNRVYVYGPDGATYDTGAMNQSTDYATKLAALWTNETASIAQLGNLSGNSIRLDCIPNQVTIDNNYGLFCI